MKISVDCGVDNLYYNSEKLSHIKLVGKMEKFSEPLSVVSIHCYKKYNDSIDIRPTAYVQQLAISNSEIISHIGGVGIYIDCSSIKLPANTFFHGFSSDFGEVVTVKSIKLIGQDILRNPPIKFTCRVISKLNNFSKVFQYETSI